LTVRETGGGRWVLGEEGMGGGGRVRMARRRSGAAAARGGKEEEDVRVSNFYTSR
jgi:hypothetical protein